MIVGSPSNHFRVVSQVCSESSTFNQGSIIQIFWQGFFVGAAGGWDNCSTIICSDSIFLDFYSTLFSLQVRFNKHTYVNQKNTLVNEVKNEKICFIVLL